MASAAARAADDFLCVSLEKRLGGQAAYLAALVAHFATFFVFAGFVSMGMSSLSSVLDFFLALVLGSAIDVACFRLPGFADSGGKLLWRPFLLLLAQVRMVGSMVVDRRWWWLTRRSGVGRQYPKPR